MSSKEVNKFQKEILGFATKNAPDLIKNLREKKKLEDDIVQGMDAVLDNYLKELRAARPAFEDDEESKDSNVGVDVLDAATSKKADGK